MERTRIPSIDIIQPCYNPLHDWELSVLEHFKQVVFLLPNYQLNLIIVNDGSTQHVSSEKIQYLKDHISQFSYIDLPSNKGKGNALRAGIKASTGIYQIYTDIDFPFELIHIKEMVTMLEQGYDVISGTRKQNYYQTLSPQRWLASKTSQFLNRVFLKLPFNDTQSGIKGMNENGKRVFAKTTINRYLADTEFLALAAKYKLKLKPLEVSLRDDIVLSKMSLKTFMKELDNFFRIYAIVFKSSKE
jgi:glycosyltransferase involved in cell wall biosynthesis